MLRFNVNKVAVLGAGVMGAQIAAQLVNLKVPVLLFDLPAKEGPKNGVVTRAIDKLKKLKPAPLGVVEDAVLIGPANYEEHLELLRGCDLIIEAIAERMDCKRDLYQKIAPFVAAHALLASNTSGLSVGALGAELPSELQARFCGIHFFNPPRYMALVELIATPTTGIACLDALEAFITSGLGKNVVRAKDTPNFIANRVGIVGMLATMREAERHGLSYEVVDQLTGKKLGRASSGTFRTADVVGLDTLSHVIQTLQDTLSGDAGAGPGKYDPFYSSFATPPVLQALLDLGHLGQKAQAGFFKKVGRDILRFDPTSKDYVPADTKANEVYGRMLKKLAAQRLPLLRNSQGLDGQNQGQFLWAVLRNSFHYAAVHLATIADNARDLDLCMRWGFGMQQGPFELWQEAGWLAVAQMVQADIDAGKALCSAPLPDWVFHGPVAERGGVHQPDGSWSPETGQFVPVRSLPVYQRQLFPESVLGAAARMPQTAGTTLHEDASIRLWTLDHEVLIASFKTKMHVLSMEVVAGLDQSVALAEAQYQGLVIWSGDEPFCAGADLQGMLPAYMAGGIGLLAEALGEVQRVMLRLRYASVPVVSAIRGLALGGGCELALHSARRVAAMESYIGLVEVGVGLVPGAGGLAYIARRASENVATSSIKEILPALVEGFTSVAMAKVGSSAVESRKLGYLLESDTIVAHKDELLFVALSEARALFHSGYRPPHKRLFAVAGRSAAATIRGSMVSMRDGGFISAYDFHIANQIAHVLCGGDVDAGSLVSEDYLMRLERQVFCQLLTQPKTHERIMGMLATGKPVRN